MQTNREAHQKAKAERADDRQAARAALTSKQQLARLDKLLGKGCGAVKERARLKKQMKELSEAIRVGKKKGT